MLVVNNWIIYTCLLAKNKLKKGFVASSPLMGRQAQFWPMTKSSLLVAMGAKQPGIGIWGTCQSSSSRNQPEFWWFHFAFPFTQISKNSRTYRVLVEMSQSKPPARMYHCSRDCSMTCSLDWKFHAKATPSWKKQSWSTSMTTKCTPSTRRFGTGETGTSQLFQEVVSRTSINCRWTKLCSSMKLCLQGSAYHRFQ